MHEESFGNLKEQTARMKNHADVHYEVQAPCLWSEEAAIHDLYSGAGTIYPPRKSLFSVLKQNLNHAQLPIHSYPTLIECNKSCQWRTTVAVQGRSEAGRCTTTSHSP